MEAIKETVAQWHKFIEGREDDLDWQYDECYELFNMMSRGNIYNLLKELEEIVKDN
jgi:hypothetical protein